MTYQEILNQLQGLGSEQNRQIYHRHGSGQNTYGVIHADLRSMAKGIKLDHELALSLWESENVDAQALAAMIADPDQLNFTTADRWLKSATYPALIKLLTGLVAKISFAILSVKKWTRSRKDHVREAGYVLLIRLLIRGAAIEEELLNNYLTTIEQEIHKSPNGAKEAMNQSLIAIAVHHPRLADIAKKAAIKIGGSRSIAGQRFITRRLRSPT